MGFNSYSTQISSYYLIDDVFVIPLDSITGMQEPKHLNGKAFIANSQLHIELEHSYKPIQILLMTATSQKVWEQSSFYSQGQQHFILPSLPYGLYFVEVRCSGGVLRKKLYIQQE